MDYYSTSCIYTASYLLAKNVKLVETEKNNHKITFIFLNGDLCRVLADEYLRRSGSVEPQAYADAIRGLKRLIYQ